LARSFRGRVERPTVEAIVETYPFVRRALEQPANHRLARAIMAYRIATSSTRFADHIPVMLCACLEALTASTKEGEVLDLLQRFAVNRSPRDSSEPAMRRDLLPWWHFSSRNLPDKPHLLE
jgi:hypothetical protein